jgi:hypothetical protein
MTDVEMRARGCRMLQGGVVPHPRGVDSAGVAALEDVRTLTLIRSVTDEALNAAVLTALFYAATWEQIGDALGVSRNAAHQRYSPRASQI